MSINLVKGANAPLGASLQKFVVGMGWDVNSSDSGQAFDLDASAFILGANGKTLSDLHFIFYNNVDGRGTTSGANSDGHVKDGAFGVLHSGDNLTGAGDGDDESINVDLSRVAADCDSITFVVTINDAEARRQNFGQVRNAYVRIYDPATNVEVVKYDLGEDFSIETAVEFGSLYKKDGAWKFKAIGAGYAGGLQKFVDKFC